MDQFFPQIWSRTIQAIKRRKSVAMNIASQEERAGLVYGDQVHRPRQVSLRIDQYSRTNWVNPQYPGSIDESMPINIQQAINVYIDKLDERQSKYDLVWIYGKEAAYKLSDSTDKAVLREVLNAAFTYDNAGSPFDVLGNTAQAIVSDLQARMFSENIEEDRPRQLVCTPNLVSRLAQSMVISGFEKADNTLVNGFVGRTYNGFEIYRSNNVLHEALLTVTANLTAGSVITIAWVAFTMRANGTAAVAGEVSLWASAAASVANLVAAINGTGTQSASTYIGVSEANRIILQDVFADAAVVSTQNVRLRTAGRVTLAETDGNASWGTPFARNLALRKGAIDLVQQIEPTVQFNPVENKTGKNLLIYDLKGIKTFDEWAQRMFSFNTLQ